MKRKTLFVTILQILCVVRQSSSDIFDWVTATEDDPEFTTEYERLLPRLDSFVENGRLLSGWTTIPTYDTKDIDLSNLGITELDGYRIFNNFPALHKLDLSSNKLTSPETVVYKLQQNTPMILNLSHNNFERFAIFESRRYNTAAYRPLFESKYFWSVDLSYNSLTNLYIDFDVVHFNLSNNRMQCHDKIEPRGDPSEKKIYVANLDLSHNSIDCQSQFFTSSLNTLDMSYNELSRLDTLLTGLNALTELNLSHNNIQYIHPQAFKSNHFLQKLYLGFNKIRYIYKWVWSPTRALEYIDLSANQLGYLEWDNEVYARGSRRINVFVRNNSNVGWSSGSTTHYNFYRDYVIVRDSRGDLDCPWS